MSIKNICALTAGLILLIPAAALATDAGETQPQLANAYSNAPNTTVDIVPTTSGHAGNLKGVHCKVEGAVAIRIWVDGTSYDLTINTYYYPQDNSSPTTYTITGWIPMNIRFGTSLRVAIVRGGSPAGYYDAYCSASYAFD